MATKQLLGKIEPGNNDFWVFGNKRTGKHLLKFSWFKIKRPVLDSFVHQVLCARQFHKIEVIIEVLMQQAFEVRSLVTFVSLDMWDSFAKVIFEEVTR
ncbi:hypothetical protein [Nostoc sp.]|uniref:hypothetical protein n=1 Tax=Nostoc sp. TaxID=1180 RepID=UPI002FFC72B0